MAGILTVTAGVIVKLPIPEFAAALNSFTGVGAVDPAGTVRGYVTLFVGFVQVLPEAQATAGVALMTEAEVDSECVPVVNVVDVIVIFQPAPEPLASITESASE